MSTQIWRKNPAVIEQLQQSPHLVPFFQAVRLMERAAILHNQNNDSPHINQRSVGQFTPPTTEVVRFSANLSLAFPGSEILKIQTEEVVNGQRWHMTVGFMGLTGTNGVLPFHYTELLFQRIKLRDEALRHFLDLFNHRTISLFYQAGVKYRLPIAYERNAQEIQRRKTLDKHTHAILSLVGLGTDHLLGQLNVHHETLVYFAGLLSQRTRPTHGLRQMLTHYFDVPVAIEEFVGEWQDLIDDVRSRLPYPGHPLGQNACLGRSAILGDKGWFAQGKIRVVLGPLNQAQFRRFAPGTTTLRRMDELLRLYAGTELNAEYVLRVARRDIPQRIQLRQTAPPTIGWDTWFAQESGIDLNQEQTLDIKVSSRRLQH
jgi:type VI secretion system protein ImpH